MKDANIVLADQVNALYDFLCNEGEGNAWEQDFMFDIYRRFIEKGMSLTEKQVEKIEELYEEHIGSLEDIEEEEDDDNDLDDDGR